MRGRSDRGHGEGRDVYVILLQSDTVQSYGRAKADTRSVGVDLGKKQRTRVQVREWNVDMGRV